MEIIVENNKNKFYNPKYDKKSNKSKNKKTQKFRPIKDLSNPDKLVGNINMRKNSNDSEGFSTSSEDYHEQNNVKAKKEPYKSTKLDFKRKYKTELCKYYEINGFCRYGDKCAYAHGKENLRLKVTNTSAYRTKKCSQFFEKGYCTYGIRCQFAHQLGSNIINNPFDKKMSYMKMLETFSKIETIKNIKNIAEKPRLQVFKEIVSNEKCIPSRLFNDIKSLGFNEILPY